MRPNTNFLVDEVMLIDTPQSFTKFFHIDYEKLKYILITHFHSDHFTDLHIICDYLFKRKNKEKVKLIAPKTALDRLYKLGKLLELKRSKKDLLKIFDVVEMKDGKSVVIDNYTVTAFKVKHNVKYPFAYTVEKDGKVAGFSGDTAYCENLIKLIEKSDIVFIDTATEKVNDTHLSTGEVLKLMTKYKNKKFYSIHTTDNIQQNFQDKLNLPNINSEILL